MSHNCGEFILGLGVLEQSAVDTNHATGNCEGVDSRVVDDDQINASILKFAVLNQLEYQALEITV
jgi:hypothetical protein